MFLRLTYMSNLVVNVMPYKVIIIVRRGNLSMYVTPKHLHN